MSEKKQYVEFKGEVRWAQVYPGQERAPHKDNVAEAKLKGIDIENDRHYEIQVECSDELFKKLKQAKIPAATTLKEYDDTDKKFIKLKATKVRGEWVFPDPTVTDASGKAFSEALGNGTEAVVTAELAPIKGRPGKTLRLKSVKVTKHVPYVKPDKKVEVITETGTSETTVSSGDVPNDLW